MTINERIKNFRKNVLHMSQAEFAAQLGMKQTSVSTFEKSGGTVTAPTIKALCMAFNLNEDWLRYGKEPMRITKPTFSLDNFVRQHGGTELEIDIMKAYFEIEPDTRAMLIQHFKERLTTSRAEPVRNLPAEEATAEAAYIKSRSGNVPQAGQSALNTTADTEPGSTSSGDLASNQ